MKQVFYDETPAFAEIYYTNIVTGFSIYPFKV